MNYDVIIVGAGFAGACVARKFAEANQTVLILEKRNHIGGNAYDFMDENEVRRHEYGPHIFHTSSNEAVEFLSEFTDWYPYEHRVLGKVEDKFVPIPFNLKSIEMIFDEEKATRLKKALVEEYGMETKVPILKLKENKDPEIRELAEFIYENVFKYYTMKQWDLTVEQIDPAVTGRVPVFVSYDDRYFQDSFQNMPKDGYTAIFERMLDHKNITVKANVNAMDHLHVDVENKKVMFDGEVYNGLVVYTGLVDELLDYRLGELSYRSLEFDVQSKDGTFQQTATVNYPTPKEVDPFTRITEYKWMMENQPEDKTTICVEYPYAYSKDGKKGNVPYYPVFTETSKKQYEEYVSLIAPIDNLVLLGRLAEYRYYNMDAIVHHALQVATKLIKK